MKRGGDGREKGLSRVYEGGSMQRMGLIPVDHMDQIKPYPKIFVEPENWQGNPEESEILEKYGGCYPIVDNLSCK
ncbi:unnamed protein product [Dovyalis caffra]|uniref:Uncharacterized protein n=1 Tax=Dovyalis caffra TaxID=77055 RepID=A0AAV1RUH4_9ROSI|nr:unnamed protein product [Dovyalis caffra]